MTTTDNARPFHPGTPWELFRFEAPEVSAPASYDDVVAGYEAVADYEAALADDDDDPGVGLDLDEPLDLVGGDFDEPATVPFDPTNPEHQAQIQAIAAQVAHRMAVEAGLVHPVPTPETHPDLFEPLPVQAPPGPDPARIAEGEREALAFLGGQGVPENEQAFTFDRAAEIFQEWAAGDEWADQLGLATARHGGDREAAETEIARAALDAARLELAAKKPGASYDDVVSSWELRGAPEKPTGRPRFKSYDEATAFRYALDRGEKPAQPSGGWR